MKKEIYKVIGIDDFSGSKREEIELTIQLLLKQCYIERVSQDKSAFEEIKESIIDSIKFSNNLTDLKERIETILQEYDLEEENAD